MMVMQNRSPKTRCSSAISIPPMNIQITLNSVLMQPILPPVNCGSCPKGNMANMPIFMS